MLPKKDQLLLTVLGACECLCKYQRRTLMQGDYVWLSKHAPLRNQCVWVLESITFVCFFSPNMTDWYWQSHGCMSWGLVKCAFYTPQI